MNDGGAPHSRSDSGAVRATISPHFIQAVCTRLAVNQRLSRKLPADGRLHIDRQLPFLCLYRRPQHRTDAGTDQLIAAGASYLIGTTAPAQRPGLARLLRSLVQTLAPPFGAFLLLEVWSESTPLTNDEQDSHPLSPTFRVHAPRGSDLGPFLDTLIESLSRVTLLGTPARVELVWTARPCAPDAGSLLTSGTIAAQRCTLLGLEVRPVYRHPATGAVYPAILRELRAGLTRSLQQAFHKFSCTQTTQCPAHYHVLGPRALVRSVWEVDRQLADVADSFDFLLQATPVNAESAWEEFRRGRESRPPVFHYRPLPVEPIVLKRRLYQSRVERVDDPAMAHLFREKLDELDRQITLLQDLNTPRFLHGSVQLYGGVEDDLFRLANDLLKRLPSNDREERRGGTLNAAAFAQRATEELDYYRHRMTGFESCVEIRDDIVSGLMVSHGSLLIGREMQIPADRVDALLQHEIGTHVLTYYNGRAQPFRQLYSGLAGYDPLQEGIAVLAEYLVGGLSRSRLRLLAARVLAARRMIDGASFVETFGELYRTYHFDRHTAFTVTMRIFRGGGLTKDAAYLRGLCQVLDYIGSGGLLQPLFVGKIAAEHIPIIRELHYREVLREPPLTPRYFERPEAMHRLEELRSGVSVLELSDRL